MPNKPYNPLSQILSSGGSIALGVAYALRWSKERISSLFARRFEPMTPSDKRQLEDISYQGAKAAAMFNNLGPGETLDPSEIPVNPHLFADGDGGERVIYVVDWSANDGANRIQDRIVAEDFKTPEQIAQEAFDDAWETLQHEYEDMIQMFGEKAVMDWVKALYIERSF